MPSIDPNPFLSTQSASTISPYGTINGELFRYSSFGLVAIESPPPSLSSIQTSPQNVHHHCYRNNKCILLGGLSDGLIPVPYTGRLLQEITSFGSSTSAANNDDNDAESSQWSFVQPILSSSYTGFGHGSLDRDVEELDTLIEYLYNERTNRNNKNNNTNNTDEAINFQKMPICLIGHSTGCQDIVHYLKKGKYINQIVCVALQGPVSDREAATIPTCPEQSIEERKKELNDFLQYAIQLKNSNDGNEFMPRNVFWAPITANRYYDLFAKGGMDDYFSSDYTTEELSERLSHIGSITTLHTCLVVWPGCDEYVPQHIDVKKHLQRLMNAMNGRSNIKQTANKNNDRDDTDHQKYCWDDGGVAKGLYLETGNHNLSKSSNDVDRFLHAIHNMLQSYTISIS